MGPGWIVSSNLEKDVNVIGNFVFEFNLITFTSGVHLILFSNLICNHLRGMVQGLLCGNSSEKKPTYYREKGPGVQGKRWPKYRYCFSCLKVRGGPLPSKTRLDRSNLNPHAPARERDVVFFSKVK